MKKLASLTAIARLRVVANAQAQKITTDWDHDANLRGGAGPQDRKTGRPHLPTRWRPSIGEPS